MISPEEEQMMLKRKIDAVLKKWKSGNPETALCIFGARQIGKTTSVEMFGKQNYSRMIKIDFIQSPKAKTIFESGLDPDQILREIELFAGTTILGGDTLLLLDEIQEFLAARTAVKYLVQSGKVHIVETGSLLGTRLSAPSDQHESLPVGFEEPVNMYPLDFEEFMWAMGIPDSSIDQIQKHFEEKKPVPPFTHEQLLLLFRTWMVVGGMPQAVAEYVRTKSVQKCLPIQKRIWELYRQDVLKYAARPEVPRILDLFESVPSQLNSQSLRFILSKASGKPKARFSEYESSLAWLTQAGIVLPCLNTSEPKFPLRLNEKRRLFRLYTLDTGLLCSQFESIALPILQQDPSLNWGAFLENAAAQSLTSNGFRLYYYSAKNMGELDFVIESGLDVIAVEMKSGKDYHKHPSLNSALAQENWQISLGIVFCSGNVETDGRITYYPWYMLYLLQKPQPSGEEPVFNLEAFDFSE